MLQCAPYIKDMCKTINNQLSTENTNSQNSSPQPSPEKKKDSVVHITDVKSFEVKVLESKEEEGSLFDDILVNAKSDPYKAIRKIRPDSPDVIRVAKRVEQAELKRACNSDEILETKEKNTQEICQNDLGARIRITG